MPNPRSRRPRPGALALAASLFLGFSVSAVTFAGPMLPAGDMALRSDIQYLADHGIIKGSVSTWPLSWEPIERDVFAADPAKLPSHLANVVLRVRQRAEQATGKGLLFGAELGGTSEPERIRGFADTPRGEADVRARAGYHGDWFTADVTVSYVDSEQDDDEVRFDDSLIAVNLGNWSIGASTQDRWWGPGWDGSLILSDNARPVPSLVIDRVLTDAFKTKWLSWIGPWDLNMMFGQMEEERAIPNAHFFGMRVSFRPFQSLDIGLSRTAQLCGDGRPCGFDTYWDMFLGQDNFDEDDPNATPDDEPGNQLAGFDARWNPAFWDRSTAFYAQAIGEDEADFLPSNFLGLLGLEWSGYLANRWSSRLFLEYAGTKCEFFRSDESANCAYNHGIYETGYRYKGRAIGHGADGDSEILSVGWVMVDPDEIEWRALIRGGKLNVEGEPDPYHSLTPTEQEIASVAFAHARRFGFGRVELGVGYEWLDDIASGEDEDDASVYLTWQSP